MTDSNATGLLRECPFCGNEPWKPMTKRWTNVFGDESWSAYVHCPKCKLTIETKACEYETADGAVKAMTELWNTRTPEQAVAATLGTQPTDAIERLRQTVRDAFSGESVSMLVEGHAIMRAIDAVAATLGAPTLTAEQVKQAYEKRWHDMPDEYDMPEANALSEYSYDWAAIADELNEWMRGKAVS